MFIILIIYLKLFTHVTIQGWTSILVVVLFLGGVQILSIGLIGEYLARVGVDIKARPLYIISEVVENSIEEKS